MNFFILVIMVLGGINMLLSAYAIFGLCNEFQNVTGWSVAQLNSAVRSFGFLFVIWMFMVFFSYDTYKSKCYA